MAKKKSVRTTVSLDEAQIGQMSVIAEANDVSLAWVIRQAVAFYLADQDKEKNRVGKKEKTMKRNVFEGFRRIRLIFQIIWAVAAIGITWFDSTYLRVTFNTYGPNLPFYHDAANDYCSSPNASESTSYTTKDGHEASVTLCFKAQKFKNASMLVPYRNDVTNEDMVWGAGSYSTEVTSYTAQRKESFRPSEEEDEWISKQYRQKRFDKYMNGIYIAVGGVVGLWVLAFVIGWIMRGFLGVPRGQDHRPTA